MNTIRRLQSGEPAVSRRSPDASARQSSETIVTEVSGEGAVVVGGSGSGKDGVVNAGDLWAEDVRETEAPAGVRAAIVASKSGNSDEAKGGRKAKASSPRGGEERPPAVPLGDKQGGEAPQPGCGVQRPVWSEKMLVALETGVKGNKWFSLIDKIHRLDVLELAWAKVQSNAGACGVDGITVEHFAKDSQKRLLAVKKHLQEGSYQPQPIKRVWIPKAGCAEKRPLGIPTVRDRVVQTALKMVIEPIFEREFAEHSYGFRPGRSCHDALRRVEELLKGGYRHVVDIDIKAYFDSIPQERLLEWVEERIADRRVLKLIEAFLKQGILEGMESWEPSEGTPQGGVISPLLANIYLHPLDRLLAGAGLEMVRYADDLVVLCRQREEAQRALEMVGAWMESAGLTLHPQKTRIVDMNQVGHHFDFLGYRFWRGKQGRLRRFVRPKSIGKLKESLKKHTRRVSGRSLPAIIARINPILRGWYGYFRQASGVALGGVDGWVRGRLRSILRKRQRQRHGRARGGDHQRWGNCYFTARGLFCLEECRAAEIASLRGGVTC